MPSGGAAVLLTELLPGAVVGGRAREVVLVEGLGPVVLGQAFRPLAGVKSVLRVLSALCRR